MGKYIKKNQQKFTCLQMSQISLNDWKFDFNYLGREKN